MLKKEIEAKKAELRNKINEAKTTEELEELRKQAEDLNNEVPEDDGTITPEEERKLIRDVDNLEKRKVEIIGTLANREERKVKEFTKFNVLKSDEYRSAWAKKLMCKPESDFTEDEKRALGVALTTTATTFTEPSSGADGVNNGGLFIPETVSMEILREVELESPFLRDIAKTYVRGLITFPYKKQGSGADG